MDDSKRSPIVWLGGLAVLAGLGALLYLWTRDGSPIPMKDFVEYWSAGKAFLDHRNPYDSKLLLELQREALNEPKLEEATMMWNPPWALLLVAPLGLLPAKAAHMLWLAVQFVAVLASVAMILRAYDWPFPRWIVGFAVALVFCPVFLLIWYGQVGGFCLLGLAGFLYFEKNNKPLTAGAFAALTALKPHLLFGFGVVLVLNVMVSAKGRRILVGGGAALAAAALTVWLYDPMVYANYSDAMRQQSSEHHKSVRDWFQPNLSYYFRDAVNRNAADGATHSDRFYLQFILTVIATVGMVAVWMKSPKPVNWRTWLPPLVLVSTICAAYGSWLFDLVVLLVPVLHAATVMINNKSNNNTYIVVGYLILSVGTGLAPVVAVMMFREAGLGLQVFVYFAPAVLLLYVWALRANRSPS